LEAPVHVRDEINRARGIVLHSDRSSSAASDPQDRQSCHSANYFSGPPSRRDDLRRPRFGTARTSSGSSLCSTAIFHRSANR